MSDLTISSAAARSRKKRNRKRLWHWMFKEIIEHYLGSNHMKTNQISVYKKCIRQRNLLTGIMKCNKQNSDYGKLSGLMT